MSQKISPSQIQIVRNNNGTAGTAPTQKEIGSFSRAYTTGTNNNTGTTNFLVPFPSGVIPVVVSTFSGDNTTTPAYGSGGNLVIGRVSYKITSITNTGFSWIIHTGDGANFGSGGFTAGYIAEG